MSVIKKHWLYRDCKFNVDVKEEPIDMERICENYDFGNNREHGCDSCLHRFTRPSYNGDNEIVFPCFKCKFFESPMIVPLGETHE